VSSGFQHTNPAANLGHFCVAILLRNVRTTFFSLFDPQLVADEPQLLTQVPRHWLFALLDYRNVVLQSIKDSRKQLNSLRFQLLPGFSSECLAAQENDP